MRHLIFDRLARVLGVPRAMPRNEQGKIARRRGTVRAGMMLDHLQRTTRQHRRHRGMRSHRTAIADAPATERAHPVKPTVGTTQTQFPGDDLLGEVAIGDEERHHIHLRMPCAPQDASDGRFLFPVGFEHLGKDTTTTDRIRMLPGRGAGFAVERRTVSDDDERGVFEAVLHSATVPRFAPAASGTRPA